MRQDVVNDIATATNRLDKIYNAQRMDNAELMDIIYMVLQILIAMLKRELKGLA